MSLPETEGIESKAKTYQQIYYEANNGIGWTEKWLPLEEVKNREENYKIMYSEILKQLKLKCDKIDQANEILNEFPPTYRFDTTDACNADDTLSEPHFNTEAQQNWLKRLREVLK